MKIHRAQLKPAAKFSLKIVERVEQGTTEEMLEQAIGAFAAGLMLAEEAGSDDLGGLLQGASRVVEYLERALDKIEQSGPTKGTVH